MQEIQRSVSRSMLGGFDGSPPRGHLLQPRTINPTKTKAKRTAWTVFRPSGPLDDETERTHFTAGQSGGESERRRWGQTATGRAAGAGALQLFEALGDRAADAIRGIGFGDGDEGDDITIVERPAISTPVIVVAALGVGVIIVALAARR